MASRPVSCFRIHGETVDRLTQCTICLGRFDDPRMLPCSHTLCRECIQGLVNCSREEEDEEEYPLFDEEESRPSSKLQCPTCRSPFSVPSGGVSGFPTNPYIADLFEGELVPPKCTEHSNYNMDMYCKTCEILLCACCCLSDHKTHSFDELPNHAEEFCQRFLELTNDGKAYKEGLQKRLDGLRQTEKDIDAECDKAIEFVHLKVEAIRKVFKAWEKKLIGSVTSHEKDSREQIHKFIELIQKRLSSIDKLHKLSCKAQQAPGLAKIEDELNKIEESPLQAVDTFGTFDTCTLSASQQIMQDLVGGALLSTQNVNPGLWREIQIDQTCQTNLITALLLKEGFIWVVHEKTPRILRYSISNCNDVGKYAIPVLQDPSGMTVAESESDEHNFVISCLAGKKLHFVYLYNRNRVIDHDIVDLDFAPGHITRHKVDKYLVVDHTNNAVAVLDIRGQVLERIVPVASPSTTNLFTSLKVAVPVADEHFVLLADSQVVWMDKNHVMRKSVLAPPGNPSHMVRDKEGRLIVADTSNSCVRYVDHEGTQQASLQIPNPTALYIDEGTQHLYVGHGEPGSLKLSVFTGEATHGAVNACTLSVKMMTFV